ncbi:hypothetical protein TWF506_006928 [Arthrobotrys conoides]|uniref:Uncharacterized protein n=1 Tax=Arthrobotrys conoides TaxID=74498 RepID=A0AAN8RVH6_9PEZI
MQLLVALTSAMGLASPVLALMVPGAGIPNAPDSLARRAAASCTFTHTITESYADSGPGATKTVFKEVGSKPTVLDCGKKSDCIVVVKTETEGKPVKTVYGKSTVVDLPYCSEPTAAAEKEEKEEKEEEEEEEKEDEDEEDE